MARTRWPPDWEPWPLVQARQNRDGTAGGCQKTWDPADRSFRKTTSGVSRLAGQAGTQATDPTPGPRRTPGSRAGSTHPHPPCRLRLWPRPCRVGSVQCDLRSLSGARASLRKTHTLCTRLTINHHDPRPSGSSAGKRHSRRHLPAAGRGGAAYTGCGCCGEFAQRRGAFPSAYRQQARTRQRPA